MKQVLLGELIGNQATTMPDDIAGAGTSHPDSRQCIAWIAATGWHTLAAQLTQAATALEIVVRTKPQWLASWPTLHQLQLYAGDKQPHPNGTTYVICILYKLFVCNMFFTRLHTNTTPQACCKSASQTIHCRIPGT